jgi:hypothetical protein
MKTLLTAILIIMFALPVSAETMCRWDGSMGVNCQNSDRGYLIVPVDGHKIAVEQELFDEFGFFPLTTTYPELGENQTRDQEQWSFDGSEITRTWTVRDLTAEEIDQRVASPMPLNTYYLWKALITKGVITQQEAAQRLPQELIDAYLARDRLENP